MKVDTSCEAALQQIKDKNYLQKANEHANEVILVGISYDRVSKRHSCVIEKL